MVDSRGNAVSNTYTLNFPYGVGLVAEGTGVLLNNELDDFTAAPGASNAFGLVGFEANLPGPGKRPLSSMSPTIVLKDGKAGAGDGHARRQPHHLGGAAGDRQRASTISMDIAAAVAAPRAAPSMAAGRGAGRARLSRGRARRACGPRATRWSSRSARPRPIRFRSTPNGLLGAPDPRTRGAEAAGQ